MIMYVADPIGIKTHTLEPRSGLGHEGGTRRSNEESVWQAALNLSSAALNSCSAGQHPPQSLVSRATLAVTGLDLPPAARRGRSHPRWVFSDSRLPLRTPRDNPVSGRNHECDSAPQKWLKPVLQRDREPILPRKWPCQQSHPVKPSSRHLEVLDAGHCFSCSL